MSTRVALFGLFGVGNHGNEASLHAALLQLRRVAPEATPFVVCYNPENVSAEHGVEATSMNPGLAIIARQRRPVRLAMRPVVELVRWFLTFRTVWHADVVLVPGTGILDDFGVRPHEMPYHLFRWALVAKVLRRPFFFVGIGAGPIEHPRSRWFFRKAAGLATSCSYRDDVSFQFMRSIGRDVSADRIVPDIVLGWPQLGGITPVRGGTAARIGLGVMAYYGWSNDPDKGREIFADYIDKLVEFLDAMFVRGHVVRLLIGETTDTWAVEELQRRASDKLGAGAVAERLSYEPVEDFDQLIEEIGKNTDVVVTTRYHNVVGALLAGRPVISIGYAEKNRDLLQQVDLADFCQHVESFAVDRLVRDTERILDRRGEVSTAISVAIAAMRARLDQEFEQLPLADRSFRRRQMSLRSEN
jgi:polysaccharide pyruvyl transferase WcaK-like protein